MTTAARPRRWFHVHSFVGAVTGLLMFVICWSGTVATLSHEVDWLLNPAQRVEQRESRASWDAMQASVKATMPDASIKSINAPPYANFAAEIIVDTPTQKSVRVYVDPYTATVLGTSSFFTVQRFFRSFHMQLFAGDFGYYVVWSFGVLLLLSVLAPLIFFKRWWQRFFSLRLGRNARVTVSELHKLAGLWTIPFALVVAITGVWYLAEGLRGDIGDGKFAWRDAGDFAIHRLPERDEHANAPIPADALAAASAAARPTLDIATIAWRSGYLYVDGQDRHWLVRDRANKLFFDPGTGALVLNQRASDQPAYWRWADTADQLHFGAFGGLPVKLLWFAFGLATCGLCLTGAYLHMKRLSLSAGAWERARWPGASAALVATVLLLTYAARCGWLEIRDYGPVIDGVQHWPQVAAPVIVFIAAWIASTIAVIALWFAMLWRRRPEDVSVPHAGFVLQPAE